jgi:uncharacterized protein (TIGR03437 family)
VFEKNRKLHPLLLLLQFSLAAMAGTPEQAMLRYLDLPRGAMPQALVADAAGNLFIVSNVVEPSGRLKNRVLKTDSQGHTLASLDFGGNSAGLGFDDRIAGAAIDPRGNLVIAGSTFSPDFLLVSPLITSTAGSTAFVVKIDSQLKNILFSTRLGGTQGGTSAGALALDKSGNIYVTGRTSDADFPVTPGAFQKQPPQGNQSGIAVYAYVTEISSDTKAILFSTYFGDSAVSCTDSSSLCAIRFGYTSASAIALDATGNVVIAGSTTANHLPVTSGVFGPNCGDCGSFPQPSASFVAKISVGGSKLVWATYIPVVVASSYTAIDISTIALDSSENIIAGGTASVGFPVTAGALQSTFPVPYSPGFAGFVMKLDSTAQRLLFSTYFGGEDPFGGVFGVTGLVADSQGAIWVTGASPLDELPVPQGTVVLGEDYVAALSSDGSTLTAIFTMPSGVVGRAIALTPDGVTAMGPSGTLLTVSPGQGPSLVGVGNSAGLTVSNTVAPYELVSLYGFGLGPQTPVGGEVVDGVVTSSLGGVQVLFDGTPAPLLFAGPTRIDMIVPSAVYGRGTTALQVVTPSGVLTGPTMLIAPSKPGVFLASAGGSTSFAPPATALNQDGSVNSDANPAALGSIVTVWASGCGISSDPQSDGTILRFAEGGPILPVSMFSFDLIAASRSLGSLPGPLSLEVLFAGDAPRMVAGVSQINFRLPAQVDTSLDNIGFSLQIGDMVSDAFTIFLKLSQ